MGKKVNTVLFILGATLLNLLLITLLFFTGITLISRFVPAESTAASLLLGLVFILSIVLSFSIYLFLIRLPRIQRLLNNHLQPVTFKKRLKGRKHGND